MKLIQKMFDKLQKVPSFVWVLTVFGSCLFATMYSFSNSLNEFFLLLNDAIESGELQLQGTIDTEAFKWISFVVNGLVGLGLFELIVNLIYRSMAMRMQVKRDQRRFMTVTRVYYTLANIVVGLIHLIDFAVPVFYYYAALALQFAVYSGAYLAMYVTLKDTTINPLYAASAFRNLARFYLILFGVLGVFDLILALTDASVGLHYRIAAGLRIAVVAGYAVASYFLYRKWKTDEDNARTQFVDTARTRVSPDSPPDDEIFRGYGF